MTITFTRDIISRKNFRWEQMKEELQGHRERLRGKYDRGGFTSLHDYEQLELLLSYVISRKDVKPIAKELILKFKTLDGVIKSPVEKLQEIDGLGDRSAIFFKVIGDVAKETFKQKAREIDIVTISGTEDLIKYLRNDIGYSKIEEFKVIFLNSSNNLIEAEKLSIGTIDKSPVYPREVVERVIYHKAKSIILAHNHPSGSLRPSRADIEITLKLKKILEILDVRILDHIILTRDSHYSFLEDGVIELGG